MNDTYRHSGIKLAAWIVVVSLVALALLFVLVTAGVNATILVDQLPTADYGTPTSLALESFYSTVIWSFLALIGVVTIGIALPFIISFRRRKKASSR